MTGIHVVRYLQDSFVSCTGKDLITYVSLNVNRETSTPHAEDLSGTAT